MRRAVPVLVALLTLPIAYAQESEATAQDRCPDLQTMPGVGPVCPAGNGLYELFHRDGSSAGFTHGPDPRCDDCAAAPDVAPAGSTAPHCVTGSTGEYFVRVIYARASDDTDRYATMVGTIRNLVGQASAMLDDSAQATGDRLAIRVKCASGVIVVENEVLPTSKAGATYTSIFNDLEAKGYNDHHQKYWVYYDDASACGCAGIGHIYMDESDSVNNLNNGASSAGAMFAVSFDSPAVRTMLHELGHNLGAVQNGAPHSTGAGHCWDGRSTMCYNDGGPNGGRYSTGFCSTEIFDCGNDDYCHANPAAGSYLDTHWQVCHRQTRFLQWGNNLAPVMTALGCAPDPVAEGDPVTCTFRATDSNVGIYYTVSWGDGTTTRVPATGTVTPGTTQTAAHTFPGSDDRVVSVVATDTGTPAMTSTPMTFLQRVGGSPSGPVMGSIECTPTSPMEDTQVSCTFVATDPGNVWYSVYWGDGTPTARVPASGTVPAGTPQTLGHTYVDPGSMILTISATNDAAPPETGGPLTRSILVGDENEVPLVSHLACPTSILKPNDPFACTFAATDDSTGVRYEILWGDGTSSSVPASGFVAPGPTRSASHSYATEGQFNITLTVVDNGAPSETSADHLLVVTVRNDSDPPTISLTDPQPGRLYQGCATSLPTSAPRAIFLDQGCVRVTSTDASGVARVELYRAGVLRATDTSAPYQFAFDVSTAAVAVQYSVRSYDTLGQFRTVSFSADEIAGAG